MCCTAFQVGPHENTTKYLLLNIYNLQSIKVHENIYIFIDTGTLIIHSNYQKHINDTDNEHTIMIT